jgi:hypothetical protein
MALSLPKPTLNDVIAGLALAVTILALFLL